MTTLTLMLHVTAVQSWKEASCGLMQQRRQQANTDTRGTQGGGLFKNNPICESTVG